LFGSVGALSSTHLNTERFSLATGIKAQHVGFRGQSEFVIEIVAECDYFPAPQYTSGDHARRFMSDRLLGKQALTSAFSLGILSPLCRYQHHQRQGKTAKMDN